MVEGRCMKCKEQKEMKDPRADTLKNGRDCIRGTCPDCGTKMCRMGKME